MGKRTDGMEEGLHGEEERLHEEEEEFEGLHGEEDEGPPRAERFTLPQSTYVWLERLL